MSLFTLLSDLAFPPSDDEMVVRNLTVEHVLQELSPVSLRETGIPVISLLPYQRPGIKECIHEAKFSGNIRATELLGSALAEFLQEFLIESQAFSYAPLHIIPLPLSSERLRERGYNQTERIVESALKKLPKEGGFYERQLNSRVLIRGKNTAPQSSLTGLARIENMKGAFSLTGPIDPIPIYMVVDDVYTTGNTMQAALETLQAGGATRLLPLTVAY